MRKMKNSGIDWIGDIPYNWCVIKVKHLFVLGRGRVIATDKIDDIGKYPVYSSQTKNNGCLGFISTYDFDLTQLTWTTDGANAGTVFIRYGKHNCTNVCGTLQLKNNCNEIKYLKYALEFIALYHKRADINGYKIMNNEMANISITFPPLKEQQTIADFLDKKCLEIDSLITDIKTQIEVLEEYKKTVITETVTKGLDKNVQMKDSGVKWIGNIPIGWDLIPPYYSGVIVRGNCGFQKDDLKDIGDYVALQYGKTYKTLEVDSNYNYYVDKKFYKSDQIVEFGDTIFITTSETMEDLGHSCYYNRKDIGLLGGEQIVLKPNKEKFIKKFFYYTTTCFCYEMNRFATGLKVNRTKGSDLKYIKIAVPPIAEQEEIAKYLDEKCSHIDDTITSKLEQITTLEEYKKSIIFEYVTGKKEVNEND